MRMIELQWTISLPTEEGWYLVWTSRDLRPDLVEIVNDGDELCTVTPFGEWLDNLVDLENSDNMWFGPIPDLRENKNDEIN